MQNGCSMLYRLDRCWMTVSVTLTVALRIVTDIV